MNSPSPDFPNKSGNRGSPVERVSKGLEKLFTKRPKLLEIVIRI